MCSSEGHEFIVDRDVVMASGTIRAMLTGPGRDVPYRLFSAVYILADCLCLGVWGETSGPLPTARFENIQTGILERIVQYFHYKAMYDTVELDRPLPNFDIKMDYVLPLMLASHFLDC